jgi:hypothetical protein
VLDPRVKKSGKDLEEWQVLQLAVVERRAFVDRIVKLRHQFREVGGVVEWVLNSQLNS